MTQSHSISDCLSWQQSLMHCSVALICLFCYFSWVPGVM